MFPDLALPNRPANDLGKTESVTPSAAASEGRRLKLGKTYNTARTKGTYRNIT